MGGEEDDDDDRLVSSTTGRPLRSRWDIFLSFRGEDTRHTFTDSLYKALVYHGVRTFRDDDELRHGEEIEAGLVEAIADSAAAIAVISRRYADSRWCLEELARLVDARKLLLPVFYEVNPSDVRRQMGPFEEDVARMEAKYGTVVVGRWKRALETAGGLRGWDSTVWKEEQLIQSLVKEVLKKLSNTPMGVARYPVGLDSRVEELMSMVDVKANGVRLLVIHGMGGAGKTTLSKALYNKLVAYYRLHSFISDVKEISKQENGLKVLQDSLIHGLSRRAASLGTLSGILRFKELISEEAVLIVLDDIDDAQQVDELVGRKQWFSEGSRIIVTTRIKSAIPESIIDGFFEMKELNSSEALQLFSYHVFGREEPVLEFRDLAKEIVSLTGGLPLALEVFGSSMLDKRRTNDWEEALRKLRMIRPRHLQDVLEISFKELDQYEQCAFLDMACLFVQMNMKRKDLVYVLKGCGFGGEALIAALASKSLIKIVERDVLWIHDQIRDMGRQIVLRGHDDPGMRSRLWHCDEIMNVLKNVKGTRNIQGIDFDTRKRRWEYSDRETYWFHFIRRPTFASAVMYLKEVFNCYFRGGARNGNDLKFHTKSFQPMLNLRILRMDDVRLEGSLKFMPPELRFLRLQGWPLSGLPADLCIEHLAVLDLSDSKIRTLWEYSRWNFLRRKKVAESLLVMNLQSCGRLTHLPNLSFHSSLEILILKHCVSLVKVHESVGDLKKLIHLNLQGCLNLVEFPRDVSGLKSLEVLNLSSCLKLSNLPEDMRSMKCLKKLIIDGTRISVLPDSMLHLKKLEKFSLKDCLLLKELPVWIGQLSSLKELSLDRSGIQQIPDSVGSLKNLEIMNLTRCKSITQIPDAVGDLESLAELFLRDSSINRLPDSLGSLSRLRDLSVSRCKSLTSLPGSIGKLASLVNLDLMGAGIKQVPDEFGSLILLQKLDMGFCQSIATIPETIGKMLSLTTLMLSEMAITELPESIGMLESLTMLNLNKCRLLQKLPASVGNLRSLSRFLMTETSVSELPKEIGKLTSLTTLKMGKKPQRNLIPSGKPLFLPDSISNLSLLGTLDVCAWNLSGEIPDEFEKLTSLKELNLSHNDFCKLPRSLRGLSALKKLSLSHCKALKSLPLLPSNLLTLRAANCSALEDAGDLANLTSLSELDLSNCSKLVDIPGLECLKSLRRLYLGGCNSCVPVVKQRLAKVALRRLFYLSIPGSTLPIWFSPEVSRFSEPRNRAIESIIVGVVISLDQQASDDFRDQLPGIVDIMAKITRLGEARITKGLDLRGVPNTNEDQLYICRFEKFDNLVSMLREGDGLQIQMRDPPLFNGLALKMRGIHLVFENDDDIDDVDEDLMDESKRSISWKLAKFLGSLND